MADAKGGLFKDGRLDKPNYTREEVDVLRACEREEMIEHTRGLNQARAEDASSEDDVVDNVHKVDAGPDQEDDGTIPATGLRQETSVGDRPRTNPGPAPADARLRNPANPPVTGGTIFGLVHADGRKEFFTWEKSYGSSPVRN
ncbi:hypothetical protein ACA910_000690 [Epithemia clementina (nom. ined.)]